MTLTELFIIIIIIIFRVLFPQLIYINLSKYI